MTEQWQELKETIIEMRDNDGTGTQQETCKFLANYMDVLEKQKQEPVLDKIQAEIEEKGFNSPLVNPIFTMTEIMDIIDKYRKEQTDADSN